MTRKHSPQSQWSVRTFLIWLVLACLLPGVIGATLLFTHQYREGRVQQEKDTIQTARALVQAVDSHLRRSQAVGQVLASSDALMEKDLARFHHNAREVIALVKLGTNIVLRDADGRQLLNTAVEFGEPLSMPGAPEQVREVFESGKPTISNLFSGPMLKRHIMSVDVPVMRDGKVAYALGVGILPETFNAILEAQSLPPGWVAAVFDSSGTIVGRNRFPEKFVGNKISPNLGQAMMKMPEGSVESITQEGIPVLSFFSRSPVTNWGVAIGIPHQSVRDALVLPLTALAAGVAALFSVGLILAWFMGGRIAHSVKALIAPAMALGQGKPAALPQVHIRESVEVGAAIARAAALLDERAATLRTREAELAEAHRLAKFGTWSWDLLTGAVHTSDSIREIYGRDIPSFAEQRGTLLAVQSWERVNLASMEVMQTGKGYDLELEVNHGGGHRIWINAKAEAIRNQDGEVIALRGTIQDITERKNAESLQQESEERFRLLADNIAQLVWIADEDGHIFWYNQRWFDYTGTTLQTMLERGWQELQHPDYRERVMASIRRSFDTRQPWQDTFPLRGRDGTYQWFLSQAIPIADTAGKVVRWFGTSTDISQQRAAQEAARESQQLLKSTMDNFPTVIAFKDSEGRFLDVNKAVENALSTPKEQICGKTMHDFIEHDAAEVLRRHDLDVMQQRQAIQVEKFMPLHGRTHTYLDTSFPLVDAQDRVYGTGHISYDVTQLKQAESALRSLNEQLKEADRRKDEFLAMLAHELRNPLAPISAAADLLRLGHLDETLVKKTSMIIARQVRHMSGLMDDLLDVSRVTRGQVTLNMEKLDAATIVADAVEQVRPVLEARKHHLVQEIPGTCVFVMGDHKRLVQVIANLLNNAAKFTPDGGELALALKVHGEQVRLIVTDKGIGMSSTMVTRAFELFAQEERTPDRSQGGLGIGLALVKSLVELHGGSVTACSEGAGKGSTFTVSLPHVPAAAGLAGKFADKAVTSGPDAGLKVMVVDDNDDAAQMLAMLLEEQGHQVFVANSGREALAHAMQQAPQVCLLDIGLPEMDGNELARQLRAHPQTSRALLVAITGYGQEQDRHAAFSAGFDHYFVKPIDPAKLSALLADVPRG